MFPTVAAAPAQLDSQFALLEPPELALHLGIGRPPEEPVAKIVRELELT